MGNTNARGGSSSANSNNNKNKLEAVLLPLAISGDVDKVKAAVESFRESAKQEATDPPITLQDFVDCQDPVEGNTALHGAVFGGHLEVVQYLIKECGASMEIANKLGCFPVWLAAGYNHTAVLEFLWETMVDSPTTKQKEALVRANTTGDTPLIAGASRSNVEACRLLLSYATTCGVVHNVTSAANHNGDTPLTVAMVAPPEPNLELIDLLLSHSSEEVINTPNKKGLTSLLLACERDNVALLKKLLDSSSSSNSNADELIGDATGSSPLAVAAFCGSKDALVYLLEKHSNDSHEERALFLEQPNDNGCTPLWLAARSGRPEVVKLLLDAGADPTITNKDGLSPVDAAKKYERVAVLALFQGV
jgi:ankyrin repeat protein